MHPIFRIHYGVVSKISKPLILDNFIKNWNFTNPNIPVLSAHYGWAMNRFSSWLGCYLFVQVRSHVSLKFMAKLTVSQNSATEINVGLKYGNYTACKYWRICRFTKVCTLMDGPSLEEHACVAQILVWLQKTCFGEILNLRYLPSKDPGSRK